MTGFSKLRILARVTKANESYQLTPLGAAVVEAMPDREQVKAINRAYKKDKTCPVSLPFNAKQLSKFYNGKIQPIAPKKVTA